MVATEGFPPGYNGEGQCVCRASQPMSGVDGIHVVESRCDLWCENLGNVPIWLPDIP